MAWITITPNDLKTRFTGAELERLRTGALSEGQGDPLPEVISQVVREVRGYVSANARNVLGEGQTVPDELKGASLARIAFELATRLPVARLMTEERKEANTSAETLLKRVSEGKFSIECPVVVSPEKIAGPSAQVVFAPARPGVDAL